ncbi:MAG: PASTA domain-containing protein [Chitinophagales bacterium]|nr:PASTA domain-containing protein [Chitinophagales bacterium]
MKNYKTLLFNLVAMVIATILLLVVLNLSFRFLTNHHQEYEVPDVVGLNLKEAANLLQNNKMRYYIVDSVYETQYKPYEVVSQSPKSGSFVKANRKIYVTINSAKPPMVKLPKLIDLSKRQAQLIIENSGFIYGKETFEPDLAKNAILAVSVNGKNVREGDEIPKGTVIDVVLGDGLGMVDVDIPDLIGLTLMEAMTVLDAVNLKVGDIHQSEEIKDQLSAYVYYQDPQFNSGVQLNPGGTIDLYITKNIPGN